LIRCRRCGGNNRQYGAVSPALIAEYQTQLPDKKLLQAKLHEFYLQNATE
jgi:hypothetical protein